MNYYTMLYKYDERSRDFGRHFSFLYFWGVFNEIIPLAFVGYETVIANSVLRASLAIFHVISNCRSWNN